MAVTEMAEYTLKNTHRTNRRGPVRWVISHAVRHWALLLVAGGGAFGNAALMGITSVLVGQAFSALLAPEPQLERLGQIAIIIAISQLSRGVLQFGRNFGFELIAQRVERNVRDELYGSLLGKSMTFHNLQPVGDTMARATNDVREVNFLFSPGFNMVIGSINFLIMPLILTPGRYHPALLLAPGLFIVAYFIALRGYLRRLSPITDEVRESFGELNTRLNEALDGVETVKGSAQEANEVRLFERNANRYRNAVVKQGNEEARFVPLLIYSIALAGGLLHAFILYQQGLLTDIGDVVGYFGLLMMLDFPTFTSLWAYSQIASGLAGARRILELMNRENDLDQNTAGNSAEMHGNLAFEDVCFSYPVDEKTGEQADCTLRGISFQVQSGKTVAIVGQTGSGKTSLAKLINRVYDVTEGRVLVDGVDVRQWNLEALRRNISIIEQDVFLFSDSISQNIAFGKPGATQEEIEAAAKAAQAHEFIMSFSEGYKTVIGERGVTLSGGQRQRLALARAFLTNPRILILDDSTSAIDSATEDKIQQAIFNAARGRTTLIITHRLSQIRWADLIIVLRQGSIAAIGSHEELMQQSEAYRRIFSES
ncbi:MAG TPA: ABC transporter ATP-binding protein [Anaerolineaceae bacterium]|nr:ABC transporter ATP-binding protein [Anaerolineaceae bacterium]